MFGGILEQVFFGNRVIDYAIGVGLFLAGFIFIKIFQIVLLKRLRRLAEKTATTIDDFLIGIVRSTLLPLAYFGAFYLCVNTLNIAPLLKKAVDIITMTVLMIFTARFATTLISYGLQVYMTKKRKDASLERSLNGILRVAKVVVWGLAIMFLLDNLGFKISAVIAGLGIGGVAVALAAQAVLGDLFSYFSIVFDRPFEIGDFIIIGDYLGTIEYIGIKTTRIRSLGGEQLIFSNTDLTNSRVRNYKRMIKRRVVFKIGTTYQTTLEQVKAIPGIIGDIIKNVKDATLDRSHFLSYGDFSLVFETVYYVMGPDYNKYMDVQQKINLAIKEEFEKRKIEFAYPTQTLFLSKNAE
ncbi:MAG: mechanosensitive ion channel family protein [Omnitrophica bacterium]|nr:mechanosensitive ion channel family protein [Candidatus Omnitrophota bacterium]